MRLIDADELIRRIEADKGLAEYIPSNISGDLLTGFFSRICNWRDSINANCL